MKTQILIFLISIPIQFFSQQTSKEFNIENQEMSFNSKIVPVESKFVAVTFKKTECITEEQRFKIKYENAKNKKLILLKNPNAFKNLEKITLFQNPFRPKTGFAYYGYHTLQNQVDHNLTPNNHLLDYNCGTRTYDWATGNHAGTDYILWPYPWKRMQENTMEVIAAAPGMIINKSDGFSDTNCDNNGNPNWNGIIVEHSDGSTTTYMHFKKNSLTTKIPGETVTAGEFLGVAGSSGSSTSPHLHFEVRDINGDLIDPYMGTCNATNSTSWWQSQENYYVPKINRISTHSVATQDTACPTIENMYEKTRFENGDLVVFNIFYRDINVGDVSHIKIFNPDGTVGADFTWAQNWGVFYPTAYAYWNFNITSAWQTGIYDIEVTFGGNTYHTKFGVRANLATENEEIENFKIYPNPVKDILYIKDFKNPESGEIIDLTGKLIKKIDSELKNGSINVNNLPKGNYLLKLKNTKQDIKTVNFIKK